MRIITVSRQFGSGGRELGKRLSDLLGCDYYDREIIQALSEEQGLHPDYVRQILNTHGWDHYQLTYRHSFQQTLNGRGNSAGAVILARQREILLEIAESGNDCVIVPDFGGFMAHHVDARYDKNENLFLPPLRTIGFNPQLKMNDSLLAQSYVEAYDISYPEAVNRISDEVNELKQHLENYGSYELTDVGTLRLNEVGSYIFEPCEAGILTPNLYGLSSFEMKSLQTIAEEEKVTANSLQPTPTVTLTTTQSIFNDIVSIYDKAPILKEGTLYEFFADYIRDYYDVTLKQCDEICKMLKAHYKVEKFYAND